MLAKSKAVALDTPMLEMYSDVNNHILAYLKGEFKDYITIDNDSILKSILASNGYTIYSDCKIQRTVLQQTSNYCIYYVINCEIPKDMQDNFKAADFIDFGGFKNLIVFPDWLCLKGEESQKDPIMGYSKQIDLLMSVFNLFIYSTAPVGIAYTIAAKVYSKASTYMAAYALKEIMSDFDIKDFESYCGNMQELENALTNLPINKPLAGITE